MCLFCVISATLVVLERRGARGDQLWSPCFTVACTPRTDDLYDLYDLYDLFPLQFMI